ncbi:MAG: hypothetical protein IKC32_01430 [Clostridia bacterium]|nr:hypothetical protein [Clostridia bacterium]
MMRVRIGLEAYRQKNGQAYVSADKAAHSMGYAAPYVKKASAHNLCGGEDHLG